MTENRPELSNLSDTRSEARRSEFTTLSAPEAARSELRGGKGARLGHFRRRHCPCICAAARCCSTSSEVKRRAARPILRSPSCGKLRHVNWRHTSALTRQPRTESGPRPASAAPKQTGAPTTAAEPILNHLSVVVATITSRSSDVFPGAVHISPALFYKSRLTARRSHNERSGTSVSSRSAKL